MRDVGGEALNRLNAVPQRFSHIAQRTRKIADLVVSLIPLYAAQGRAYLTVAFGCTGGRPRSVFSAETLAARLKDDGYEPTLIHRDLAARAADTVEGPVP